MSDHPLPSPGATDRAVDEPRRVLSPAAQRALAEAEARRRERDAKAAALAATTEIGGRGGLDPVRFQDWEIGGRAIDF